VKKEHCETEDSETEFTTTNYGVTTTPKQEWQFVFDDENSKDLRLTRGTLKGKDLGMREKISTAELKKQIIERMHSLSGLVVSTEDIDAINLSQEEIGCLRLYTGFFVLFFFFFVCQLSILLLNINLLYFLIVLLFHHFTATTYRSNVHEIQYLVEETWRKNSSKATKLNRQHER
jgi:hypothetical protein